MNCTTNFLTWFDSEWKSTEICHSCRLLLASIPTQVISVVGAYFASGRKLKKARPVENSIGINCKCAFFDKKEQKPVEISWVVSTTASTCWFSVGLEKKILATTDSRKSCFTFLLESWFRSLGCWLQRCDVLVRSYRSWPVNVILQRMNKCFQKFMDLRTFCHFFCMFIQI